MTTRGIYSTHHHPTPPLDFLNYDNVETVKWNYWLTQSDLSMHWRRGYQIFLNFSSLFNCTNRIFSRCNSLITSSSHIIAEGYSKIVELISFNLAVTSMYDKSLCWHFGSELHLSDTLSITKSGSGSSKISNMSEIEWNIWTQNGIYLGQIK